MTDAPERVRGDWFLRLIGVTALVLVAAFAVTIIWKAVG